MGSTAYNPPSNYSDFAVKRACPREKGFPVPPGIPVTLKDTGAILGVLSVRPGFTPQFFQCTITP